MAANQAPTALAEAASINACVALAPASAKIGSDSSTPNNTARPARFR